MPCRTYEAADAAVAARLSALLEEVSRCAGQHRYTAEIMEQLAWIREAIKSGVYVQAERERLLELAQKVASLHGRS